MIARWAALPLLTWCTVLPLLIGLARAQTPAMLVIDVPFERQPKNGCGAASIAMVMEYWAAQKASGPVPETSGPASGSDVATIQRQLYSPREHGIAAAQIEQYLRDHGFQVFALNGHWSDLEDQLGKGRPLIAALKPKGQAELHYVVIDGIDRVHQLVMFNDPAERKMLTQQRAGFEKDWSATNNWILLAVPAPAAR